MNDPSKVICPACCHEFPAIPENVQAALAAKDAEIERLNQAIRLQGSAAISGMDAAKRVSSAQLEQAARLHAESNPGALNSERAMNAQLTEENERLEAEIAALRALLDSYNLGGWTDAERLAKDCEALRADAERWRGFLDLYKRDLTTAQAMLWNSSGSRKTLTKKLDAAIDAAMADTPPTPAKP